MDKFFIGIVFLLVVFVTAHVWASMSIVQFSHSTGECVAVIGDGSCDALPKKYAHEWVK